MATAAAKKPTEAEADAVARIDALRVSLQVFSDSEVVEFINIFIYGEPGSGNTYFMVQLI
jgi:hypothetical protein